jgi:hypothetical protein
MEENEGEIQKRQERLVDEQISKQLKPLEHDIKAIMESLKGLQSSKDSKQSSVVPFNELHNDEKKGEPLILFFCHHS